MSDKNKLALFDIDGTIAVHGKIAESVISGMEHIQSLGFITTVTTGRGYRRMKDVLGKDFDKIISEEALIILEHGAKIVTKDGEVVYADYLAENEIEHAVDFIEANADMIRYLWFITPDPKAPYQVWCKAPEYVEEVRERRGAYSDVFHCSYAELRQRLLAQPLSSITTVLQDYISVENLKLHFTRSDIDTIFQDGMMDFVRNIADKGKAVAYVQQHEGIELENTLVAGNAINDVEMLNLKANRRILVGTDDQEANVMARLISSEEVIRIESPEELGTYLQEIS